MTAATALSDGPAEVLRRRIERHGPVGFDEFMAVALYHPVGGYYASDRPHTGKQGDFFTSVSVGPVFGKLLAAQFLEMRGHLGDPADFTLVEQGAHNGRLLADILSVWTGPLPRLVIIEPLPVLRARQQKNLAPWSARLTHVTHEKELPPFTGVFFANELLDSFPVKILARHQGAWRERRVDYDGTRFVFTETEFAGIPPTIPGLQADLVTETCPGLAPWMEAVARKLARGWLLLVDYGHPAAVRRQPARARGTLAAYRAHRCMDDPLADPGTQDITAHVDFTAVAEAARDAGLGLAGFTDQHHALAALASRVFPAMPENGLSPAAAREMRALRQLLHPESMGTSFKFLALSKNAGGRLSAFRFAHDPQDELFA